MRLCIRYFLSVLFLISTSVVMASVSQEWIEQHYIKEEFMIPMRDGVRLYTAVYSPKVPSNSPIMLTRTPYGCGYYGKQFAPIQPALLTAYFERRYFFVQQDVRGRYMSEGEFEHTRPLYSRLNDRTCCDDATDVYDTIEWLLKHLKGNNGRVGLSGCSYGGYYAYMGALSQHPAIEAVSAQAPIGDWFLGDDFHQHGALRLSDAFNFHNYFRTLRDKPSESYAGARPFAISNEYSFFMNFPTLTDALNALGDSVVFWKNMADHPDYDRWWQMRNSLPFASLIHKPMLVVGGFFDAEDSYGAFSLYRALVVHHHCKDLYLALGPWSHGQWMWRNGSNLGKLSFGENTAVWYEDSIEIPFFDFYLRGEGEAPDKTNVFIAGSNQKYVFKQWPPRDVVYTPVYLNSEGRLSSCRSNKVSVRSYESDPSNPVPYTGQMGPYRTAEFMVDDQRFAFDRHDVLSYVSEPLSDDLTLTGPVEVRLRVRLETTDADFIVKLIDYFPADLNKSDISEGMFLIRGEVMRGRYRNSFTHPKGFVPGKTETIKWKMTDVGYTFRKNHRLMLQIQSTWFPLIDRNPQQFMNMFSCRPDDYRKTIISVLEGGGKGSCIILPVLKQSAK